MSPNRYFICCEQCFEDIGRRNTRAAKFWMDFCAYQLEVGSVFALTSELEKYYFSEINTLEKLGFLVSTDGDDEILIRARGYMNTEEGEPFFCVRNGLHA